MTLKNFTFLLLLLTLSLKQGFAINCYSCHSRNGTDVNCHDPYHPALSNYIEKCMEPKEGHIGRFPANFCLKMIGTVVSTGELLVIRRCALTNMDNQCGVFKFNDDILRGCILTCNYNGCNDANIRQISLSLMLFTVTVMFSVILVYNN